MHRIYLHLFVFSLTLLCNCQTPSITSDTEGNIHLNVPDNASIFINGIDFSNMIEKIQLLFETHQQTTPHPSTTSTITTTSTSTTTTTSTHAGPCIQGLSDPELEDFNSYFEGRYYKAQIWFTCPIGFEWRCASQGDKDMTAEQFWSTKPLENTYGSWGEGTCSTDRNRYFTTHCYSCADPFHVFCSARKIGSSVSCPLYSGGLWYPCFPGWAQVTMADGRTQKPLRDLAIGDQVLCLENSSNGAIKSCSVTTFLNARRNKTTTFLQFSLENLNHHVVNTLSMTPDHKVFRFSEKDNTFNSPYLGHPSGEFVSASSLEIGDLVMVHASNSTDLKPNKIVAIARTQEHEYYSPLTTEGTLFVERTLVSSFAGSYSHEETRLQNTPLWQTQDSRFLTGTPARNLPSAYHPFIGSKIDLFQTKTKAGQRWNSTFVNEHVNLLLKTQSTITEQQMLELLEASFVSNFIE